MHTLKKLLYNIFPITLTVKKCYPSVKVGPPSEMELLHHHTCVSNYPPKNCLDSVAHSGSTGLKLASQCLDIRPPQDSFWMKWWGVKGDRDPAHISTSCFKRNILNPLRGVRVGGGMKPTHFWVSSCSPGPDSVWKQNHVIWLLEIICWEESLPYMVIDLSERSRSIL